ncbi:MAG: hypothetical protein MR209_04000 [Veillonellaceae bacterium]|nr:hypothetical protein [Veillonellaceae bacterium]
MDNFLPENIGVVLIWLAFVIWQLLRPKKRPPRGDVTAESESLDKLPEHPPENGATATTFVAPAAELQPSPIEPVTRLLPQTVEIPVMQRNVPAARPAHSVLRKRTRPQDWREGIVLATVFGSPRGTAPYEPPQHGGDNYAKPRFR